ncbi:hypothetical protein O4J56_19320 [Nocardiopsis sp. RSe5-2]|uniref:ABC transporter permease n=1 Tax=Nocardiopsis endophytica TaxID=3018445 RepID=A0ABT4U772_9ACTN|nr:hypothetical protein [Nocardiopsis endophytica]MDA2812804.1 hypothetical protein [Nocardiopsis endophytica]
MSARAFAALVRLELWRILRNPLLLAAVAYGLWEQWTYLAEGMLVDWGWIVDDIIDTAPFPALGVFFAAFFPGSRERRYAAASALPVSPRLRMAALLTAAATAGAVALVPNVVMGLHPWSPIAIAGVLSPAALLIPLVIGAAAGAAGVALGLWCASWVFPALAVSAVVAYQFTWVLAFDVPDIPGGGLVAGAFSVLVEVLLPGGTYSPGMWGMVPGHLGFLALLTAVCCGLALVRAERRRGRPRLAAAGATAVFAAGALAVYGQVDGMEARNQEALMEGTWTAAVGPVPDRVCERLILEYCGYETYESWFPHWQRAGEAVAAAVPERARDRLPTVQQSTYAAEPGLIDSAGTLRDGVAYPDPGWSTQDDWSRLLLAEEIALGAVGAPESPDGMEPQCTLHGQARYAVKTWLVLRAADDPVVALGDLVIMDDIRPRLAEVATVRAMLDHPEEDIVEALDAHWEELVAPDTPAGEARGLLGVEVDPAHMAEAADMIDEGWFPEEEEAELAEEWLVYDDGFEVPLPAPCT